VRRDRRVCLFFRLIKKMTDGDVKDAKQATPYEESKPTTVERETETRGQNAREESSQHNRNDVQHNRPKRLRNNRTEIQGSRNKDKDGQRPSLTGGGTPRTQGWRVDLRLRTTKDSELFDLVNVYLCFTRSA